MVSMSQLKTSDSSALSVAHGSKMHHISVTVVGILCMQCHRIQCCIHLLLTEISC